jgi:hypothetical protein
MTTDTTNTTEGRSFERPVDQPDYRSIHAKADKQNGRRAYSDRFNHVLVRLHCTDHGMDLACAVRLREDLDRAIRNAALPDDSYLNLCG